MWSPCIPLACLWVQGKVWGQGGKVSTCGAQRPPAAAPPTAPAQASVPAFLLAGGYMG